MALSSEEICGAKLEILSIFKCEDILVDLLRSEHKLIVNCELWSLKILIFIIKIVHMTFIKIYFGKFEIIFD